MKLRHYKYAFFVTLAVAGILAAWIAFSEFRTHSAYRPMMVSMPPASASDPSNVSPTSRKIETLTATSITVGWISELDKRKMTATFAVDTDTKVYFEVPKDSDIIAKEHADFEEKLNKGTFPLIEPPPYTLKDTTFSALKVGMKVQTEQRQVTSTTTRETKIVARTILIEPGQGSATTAQ